MSIVRQKQWMAPASWDDVKRSWMNFGKDLRAFASLQIAWFIVWRALRRDRREIREQTHKYELDAENSAGLCDGKLFESNQRNTEHEKSVAVSMGQRHPDGLVLITGREA